DGSAAIDERLLHDTGGALPHDDRAVAARGGDEFASARIGDRIEGGGVASQSCPLLAPCPIPELGGAVATDRAQDLSIRRKRQRRDRLSMRHERTGLRGTGQVIELDLAAALAGAADSQQRSRWRKCDGAHVAEAGQFSIVAFPCEVPHADGPILASRSE